MKPHPNHHRVTSSRLAGFGAVLGLALFAVLAAAGPALAQVYATGGQAVVVDAASTSLTPGVNENNFIQAFVEQQCFEITEGLLDANFLAASLTPGEVQNTTPDVVDLPAGHYSSFYLFFDPEGGAPHSLKTATGEFSFDEEIVALLVRGNMVAPSDTYFNGAADYTRGSNWAAEGSDYFTLNADPKKIEFHLRTESVNKHNTDGVRILTACPQAVSYDVCLSGCTYSTIHQAVNNSATDGGTIYVSDEVHSGSITIPNGKIINIVGAGQGSTIVDGGGTSRCFNIRDNTNVNISGMTIQNCRLGADRGPGISMQQNAVVVVDDCDLSSNYSGREGGAIHLKDGAHLTLTNSIVSNNTATGGDGGGGIAVVGGSTLDATNVQIFDNHATMDGGGGIQAAGGSTVNLTGCSVTGNFSHSGHQDSTAMRASGSQGTTITLYGGTTVTGTCVATQAPSAIVDGDGTNNAPNCLP